MAEDKKGFLMYADKQRMDFIMGMLQRYGRDSNTFDPFYENKNEH